MIFWTLIGMLACGQEESTSTTTVTMVEILEKTTVMDESWIYPHTTVVPVISQDEPILQEAEQLANSGNNMAAAQLLVSILKERPDLVAAHSLLSSILVRLGDVEQAIEAAIKVVELRPSAWSYSNLGTLYILNEDFEAAKMSFEQSLLLDPKYFLALRNLGSIAYQTKDYEAAEDYFQQFIRIEPNDSYGYVSYGQILVEQGKLEAAKEVYQYRLKELSLTAEAFKRTPSGLILDLPLALAEVHRRLGKEDLTLQWLKQGIAWSWEYDGHWTKSEIYEDKAYERLLQLMVSHSIVEQKAMTLELQEWCMVAAQEIEQPERCEKMHNWLSTLDTAVQDTDGP